MRWGREEGCDFFEGAPEKWDARYTCDDAQASGTSEYVCTADNRMSGVCTPYKYGSGATAGPDAYNSVWTNGDPLGGVVAQYAASNVASEGLPPMYTYASKGQGYSSAMDYAPVASGSWNCQHQKPSSSGASSGGEVGLNGTVEVATDFSAVFSALRTDVEKFSGQAHCPECRCLKSSLREWYRAIDITNTHYGLCYRTNCYQEEYLQFAMSGGIGGTAWYTCPKEGGKLYIPGFTGALVCPPAKAFCKFETITGKLYSETHLLSVWLWWSFFCATPLVLTVLLGVCCILKNNRHCCISEAALRHAGTVMDGAAPDKGGEDEEDPNERDDELERNGGDVKAGGGSSGMEDDGAIGSGEDDAADASVAEDAAAASAEDVATSASSAASAAAKDAEDVAAEAADAVELPADPRAAEIAAELRDIAGELDTVMAEFEAQRSAWVHTRVEDDEWSKDHAETKIEEALEFGFDIDEARGFPAKKKVRMIIAKQTALLDLTAREEGLVGEVKDMAETAAYGASGFADVAADEAVAAVKKALVAALKKQAASKKNKAAAKKKKQALPRGSAKKKPASRSGSSVHSFSEDDCNSSDDDSSTASSEDSEDDEESRKRKSRGCCWWMCPLETHCCILCRYWCNDKVRLAGRGAEMRRHARHPCCARPPPPHPALPSSPLLPPSGAGGRTTSSRSWCTARAASPTCSSRKARSESFTSPPCTPSTWSKSKTYIGRRNAIRNGRSTCGMRGRRTASSPARGARPGASARALLAPARSCRSRSTTASESGRTTGKGTM